MGVLRWSAVVTLGAVPLVLGVVVSAPASSGAVFEPPVSVVSSRPVGGSGAARVVSHGSWVEVGPLPFPREDADAIRLPSGGVLLIGGGDAGDCCCVRAVDRYDPATNVWLRRAPMPRRRCSPVVRLASGRVLVAGGMGWNPKTSNTPAVRSAEIYDPRTNRWSRTGSMHHRGAGVGVLLRGGRVLMTPGGYGGVGIWAEIYHPGTGTWRRTGAPVSKHSALVRLRGGDVLAVGSQNARPKACAERYRARRHTWTAAGRYPWLCPGRSYLPVPTLRMRNGHVMVIDGRRVHVYNPATNHWRSLPNLPLPVPNPNGFQLTMSPQALVSVHGHPFVIASRQGCSPAQARTIGILWLPHRHAWQRWTTLPNGAFGIAVTTIRDGSVLLAGGVRWRHSCGVGGLHIPSRIAYRYYPDL